MSKENIKVWINMDDSIVDLSVLENALEKEGISLTKHRTFENSEIVDLFNTHQAAISASEKWDEEQFSKLKGEHKLIVKYGSGLNNIDLNAASSHGVYIANLPGANSNAVAEVALIHILNLCRNFSRIVENTKNKGWPGTIEGTELDGKTIGLYGYGNISRKLAKKLSGFDVEIIAYDKYCNEFPEHISPVESQEELFEKSDIVSLHIPLTNETKEVIDMNLLKKLGEEGYLVNTCRGEVVNENDLLEALKQGIIAGAGVDVLTQEPPENERIYDIPNLYITSHMGAATRESEERSQLMLAKTIVDYIKNEKLNNNVVNKEEF